MTFPVRSCLSEVSLSPRLGQYSTSSKGRKYMQKLFVTTCLTALTALAAGTASANEELIKMSQNPEDWVMPTGDYANHLYSPLKQLTVDNVSKFPVPWSRCTAVLPGHQG